jgi:hypothetical protein
VAGGRFLPASGARRSVLDLPRRRVRRGAGWCPPPFPLSIPRSRPPKDPCPGRSGSPGPAVLPNLHPGDGEAAVIAWAHDFADLAAREGYAYSGGFADVRGQFETGLYRLLDVLRAGDGVAVLVPDLDHLRHAGCLAGADLRIAARCLRAPDRGPGCRPARAPA